MSQRAVRRPARRRAAKAHARRKPKLIIRKRRRKMTQHDDDKKRPAHQGGPHPQAPAKSGGKEADPMAAPKTDTSNNPEPEPEKK